MESTLDPAELVELTCPACGTVYRLDGFDADRIYLCARCDRSIQGSGGSFDTLRDRPRAMYLYSSGNAPPGNSIGEGMLGRYSLRGELGRGGMGVVYRAWDPELSRFVALKVLLAGEHAGVQELERFLREARAAAQLDHANIVRVLDIDRDEQRAFFTMDLVDGPSLADVIDAWGPRPVREAVRIVASVARALHEAHRRGLLHRDVKPGNVLLQTDGTPLLTDFGLVTAVREVDARITRTGQVLGTPSYMAPEQATDGAGALTPKADQYALGAVLYEALAGRPPYDGTAMEVLMSLVGGPPRPVEELRADLPRDVAVMLARSMDRDRDRRYASCLAFAEDLERWLAGEPILARPPTLPYRARLWMHRHRREVTFGLVGLMALIGGGLGWQGWTDLRARSLARSRELAATERWEQVRGRIDDLVAEGDEQAAAQAFAAFVDDPDHGGTAVLAGAWRDHGGRAQEAGRLDAAVDAFGVSYVESRSAADQQAALLALAGAFESQWRFDALDVVLDALDGDDPRVGGWRAKARLARGDLARGAEALPVDDPRRPALQALSAMQPLPWTGRLLELRGGDDVLIMADDGSVVQFGLAPGLPERRRFSFGGPAPYALRSAATDPLTLVGADDSLDGVATAWQLEPSGQLTVKQQWQQGRLGDALLTDAGLLVGVGPYGRQVLRVDLASGRVDGPVPDVDAAASDVQQLLALDMDADGVDEVLVASGAWWAYDLRVLGADFALRARRKLGSISSLRAVRSDPSMVLLAKSDEYASRKVFPAEAPYGAPSGVYRMRLEGGQLVDDVFLPNPVPHDGRSCTVPNAWQGDIDGDGVDDIVAWVDDAVHGAQTLVWRASGDGWAPLALGGIQALAMGNLDDDPAMEVVVHIRGASPAYWALGMGDGTRDVPERVAVDPQEVPAGEDGGARRVWERAEQLVRMGLVERSARQLEALAGWTTDPLLARRAELRAGQMWEAAGEDARAANSFARAGAHPDLADEALDSAALALERSHRFEEALAAAQGRSTPTARSLRERVGPFVEDSRTVTLDFTSGLPDGVQLHDPVAVRFDTDPGLRMEVLANDDAVLSWPFHWDGRRLTLEVDLSLERLEWASGLEVSVQDGAGQKLGVLAQGWGGGDVLEHELGCRSTLLGGVLGIRDAVDGPGRDAPLRFVLDVAPATGDLLCTITGADGEVLVRRRDRLTGSLSPGDWTLTVAPTGDAGLPIPMMARALLASIRVTGGGVQARTTAPSDPFITAIARGQGDLALSLPAAEGGAASVWRAAALADAGRWEEGTALLRASLGRDGADREVLHLLRSRAASFGPLLSEVVVGGFAAWFDRAWTGALYAHVDDPLVQRALMTQLGGLEQAPVGPQSVEAELRRVALLVARSQAWSRQGEAGAARRDLRVATELVEAVAGRAPQAVDTDIRSRVSAAQRTLAAQELAVGRRDAALRHAQKSLEVAGSADIARDALRVLPGLSAVWSDPEWAALIAEP